LYVPQKSKILSIQLTSTLAHSYLRRKVRTQNKSYIS